MRPHPCHYSIFKLSSQGKSVNFFSMKYVKCGAEVFEFKLKPLSKKCSYCEENAILRPEGTSLYLCKECFLRFCEKRVKENVIKYKMLSEGDRVGVFLSGGKDSATLLAILKKLFPTQNIIGIYLNLGIRYYSDYAQSAVEALCKKLEVPLHIIDLVEREGVRIDDFVFTSFKDKICSVCGVIKRYYFTNAAKELNLDVIATGHHLDDTLSTMLSLFFNGDFISLSRLRPVLLPLHAGQAKKVKPLFSLPELDVFHYAVLSDLTIEGCSCPHGELTPAKRWKSWLNEMLKEDKTFKFRLLSIFMKKLLPLLPKEKLEKEDGFSPCQVCGEPTPSKSEVCVKCRRVSLLQRVEDKRLEWTSDEFLKYYLQNRDRIVVFDVREKEDYEVGSFPSAIWIDPNLISAEERDFFKHFKNYRRKELFFLCYSGRLSYLFVLRLRKLGFKAYNIKNPEKLFQKTD